MKHEERIEICKICENRKFDRNVGLLCGLTDKKADFENMCVYFSEDTPEKEDLIIRELEAIVEDENIYISKTRPGPNFWMGLLTMIACGFAAYYVYIKDWRWSLYAWIGLLFSYGLILFFKGLAQLITLINFWEREDKINRDK